MPADGLPLRHRVCALPLEDSNSPLGSQFGPSFLSPFRIIPRQPSAFQ